MRALSDCRCPRGCAQFNLRQPLRGPAGQERLILVSQSPDTHSNFTILAGLPAWGWAEWQA